MYSHIFLGGTFDRLHRGHEAVLDRAFAEGDRVTIGLTSDLFIQKFRTEQHIQPFDVRKKRLIDWLSTYDYENRADVIAIDDPYEPAASTEDLDAIVVTPDNRSRGEEINTRRVTRGLSPLVLIEVPLVVAQDAKPISATRVRAGEIDVTGTLTMPDSLRPELVRPLGTILTGDEIGSSIEKNRSGIVISVGDMTTKTLLTAGVVPNLSIVDFAVGRKPFPYADAKFKELNIFRVEVVSGPGFIAGEAIELIKKWSLHPPEKIVIVVTGEEDLLALPAVAYAPVGAPVGAFVYYGQPGEGLVEVTVTSEKQQETLALLAKFIV